MFCPTCGKQSAPDANFCSACGAAFTPQPLPPRYPAAPPILRPRSPRMIAGVCSGIALRYGWDLVLVRILLVVFTFLTGGLGILLYLVAWIVIPEAPYALTAGPIPPPSTSTSV